MQRIAILTKLERSSLVMLKKHQVPCSNTPCGIPCPALLPLFPASIRGQFYCPSIRNAVLLQSVGSIKPIEEALQKHNVVYTKSKSGRAALFFRDPDHNVLEMAENGVGA